MKKRSRLQIVQHVLSAVAGHPANRATPVRAVVRALGWQVFKRTVRRAVDVRFADGFVVRCHPNSNSASNVIYFNRMYDWHEMRFMRRWLSKGGGMLDVGANIGTYAILGASLVGPTGRVECLEPFGAHAARIRENARINGFAHLQVHEVAVSDHEGVVQFVVDRDVSNRIKTHTDAQATLVDVPVSRIDTLIDADHHFDLGKLDVEGVEVAALQGAARRLAAHDPPVWIIEVNEGLLNKRGTSSAALEQLLTSNGFEFFVYDADDNQLSRVHLRDGHAYNNVFAIAADRLDDVRARLAAADPEPAFDWTWRAVRLST